MVSFEPFLRSKLLIYFSDEFHTVISDGISQVLHLLKDVYFSGRVAGVNAIEELAEHGEF